MPLNGGDKYQVIVHINAGAGREAHDPPVYIENGPVLSPSVVKRLASDASLVTVVEDGKGNVLNVGRKTRTIPPSIRRALTIRDKGWFMKRATVLSGMILVGRSLSALKDT